MYMLNEICCSGAQELSVRMEVLYWQDNQVITVQGESISSRFLASASRNIGENC